jgi:hypothetical protein
MKPFDTLMKNASEEKQYAGPGVRPGRLMVRRPSQRALLPCPTADGHWGAPEGHARQDAISGLVKESENEAVQGESLAVLQSLLKEATLALDELATAQEG